MTAPRAGVLVDCDGTLVDTTYLHTIAWFRALRELDVIVPMHAIHRLVGMGADQLVPELVGHELAGADDEHARHYEELAEEMVSLPGAADLLRSLDRAGLTVVLASSAPASELRRVRTVLDADDVIDAVVTGDDIERSKPDPEIFQLARDRGGLDAALVLAVGDSVWDVNAARAAGMGCIAVETGGFSRHELFEAGAVAVYRSAEELGAQLATSPIGALIAAMDRARLPRPD